MKVYKIGAVVFTATMLLGPGLAFTAEKARKIDEGMREYRASCAVCHGETGKGDGPYRQYLTVSKVPDLTVLSKNNGGVFPIDRVYSIIDGREQVEAHGPRDMPIWGTAYGFGLADLYGGGTNEEAAVRSRILLLIDYLYRLQVK